MKGIKKLVDKKYFMTIVWVILIIAVWEIFAFIVAATKRTPENILPHLSGIIESAISKRRINGGQTAIQMVMTNAAATLSRAGIGYIIGIICGFILALLMSLWKPIEKIAFPYLMLIQMIPILGMAPIINAITGDITMSRVVIAAILTFYPVATNTLAGFKSVSREKHELMYSYAADKRTVFLKLRLPNSIPYIFTALKVSVPSIVITALVSEYFAEYRAGFGSQIRENILIAQYSAAWAYIAVACIIGIALFVLLLAIEGIYLKNI